MARCQCSRRQRARAASECLGSEREGVRAALANRHAMLLKRHAPRINTQPPPPTKGLEHVDESAIAVVRWLNANHIDYVLVGAVAQAARGNPGARGPVAIVAAPYRRNFERLNRALW